MSWGRDDPGFPPSPDPAAQAEEHFYRLSLTDGPDEPPWECETCHDRGFISNGEDEGPCPDCAPTVHAQPATSAPVIDIEDEECPF